MRLSGTPIEGKGVAISLAAARLIDKTVMVFNPKKRTK